MALLDSILLAHADRGRIVPDGRWCETLPSAEVRVL